MTTKPETNGNSSNLGKRKKNRYLEKSFQMSEQSDFVGYLNRERYEPTYEGFMPYGHVWRPIVTDRRLYPTMSDPTVCDYPLGFNGVSVEPTSLPIYPVYERSVFVRPRQPFPMGVDTEAHKKSTATSRRATPTKRNDTPGDQDCASLPPVIDRLVGDDSENKRRFSDPGIGPLSSDSEASSGCGSVIAAEDRDNAIIYSLVEQLNCLKESHRKLYRELHETKTELCVLRQQINARTKRDLEYEPGMLADIVREMRDAAKVREDALMTKVRHLIEERNFSRAFISPTMTTAREIDDLKIQLKIAVDEKELTNARLEEIEKQLQSLKLSTINPTMEMTSVGTVVAPGNSSDDGEGARQVLELEQENIELRRGLQEFVAGRKQVGEKNAKLELRLNNTRKNSPRQQNGTGGVVASSSNGAPDNRFIQQHHPHHRMTNLMSSPNVIAASTITSTSGLSGSVSSLSTAATESVFPSSVHADERKSTESGSPLMDRGSIISFESNTSPLQQQQHHVTLSGPVTDL